MRAYLSVDEIVAAAVACGADAIYPGYGFLSENPELPAACAAAGITFVGPDAGILELTGNKARAIAAARDAGLPVLMSSTPSSVTEDLRRGADHGIPVVRQGRCGWRWSRYAPGQRPGRPCLRPSGGQSRAESAFGDRRLFLEQAVINPRHIEVQIPADTHGDVIHLYERDCSVQRRHPEGDRACTGAQPGSRSAGTDLRRRGGLRPLHRLRLRRHVEFLLDERGNYVFIEMNPRIQVEHTVTEEITDVDLVSAQLRIASGETLAELGLSQDAIRPTAALQCRITTEDPANGFRPDTGRITTYRSPAGQSRLDGGTHHGRRSPRTSIRCWSS